MFSRRTISGTATPLSLQRHGFGLQLGANEAARLNLTPLSRGGDAQLERDIMDEMRRDGLASAWKNRGHPPPLASAPPGCSGMLRLRRNPAGRRGMPEQTCA